jgi:maltose alpha-D-glucosyltransferase/alpha-amylase
MPKWLKDAIFYEIYPQSFYDSNGDGIGDIRGIIEKIDYVKQLGCNAIWLNPVYDSPFKDAGYDVRNYKKVAARYGTNEDMAELIQVAHKKKMRIIMDLVPGHTSDTHSWFKQAKQAKKNKFSNRYIFTDCVWNAPPEYRMMCGLCERDGNYMVNYFSSQPALNYGFAEITDPKWQLPVDHPDCQATVSALKDVMKFWLDQGADGFRVDMADSLVKNDDTKEATAAIWADIRKMLDSEYPEAVLVAEWCNPAAAINKGGFHCDFYLDHIGNGYNALFRGGSWGDKAFFNKNGEGNIRAFVDEYLPAYNETKGNGYISLITCNHDTPRMTAYLDEDAIKIAYATIFTLPGVPFLYYGDEIGMRYLKDLTSVEGGYSRTGSRSPMQWNKNKNFGFSQSDTTYIPVDSDEKAPTVENQRRKKGSIYKVVKDIIKLRKKNKELSADGDFEVLYAEENSFPFVYKRGNFIILVNPLDRLVDVRFDYEIKAEVYKIGDYVQSWEKMALSPQSFVIVEV